MASRDLHNNLHFKPLFSPKAAVMDNTAQVSNIIDMLGYEGVEFVLNTGADTDTDATFTTLVEHGNDAALADAVAVPDSDLLGTEAEAGYTFADDNECRKIGYKGNKRYARVTVTPANNTGTVYLGGTAVLGHPRNAPTPTIS